MATPGNVPSRPSVQALQDEYHAGNKKPLEDLIRAWIGIKNLPADDPRSFFILGGFHGEPFQYRDKVDALSEVDFYAYWGGWCNHGNVLFPIWHRVYVLFLEKALQSIVPGVMLPFWDETSTESVARGIPEILTQQKFELDGEIIDNPLRSFVLPNSLGDHYPPDQKPYAQPYTKPAGYETVRYPLSGLVGTEQLREETAAHNRQYPDPVQNTRLLNENVVAWLHGAGPQEQGPTPEDPDPTGNGIFAQFQACLDAPNYTVFSNTTSASEWALTNPGVVFPLEAPHNDIHLSVGGFDIPTVFQSGQLAGANGDMGENNTAGLDPIFFFHHCNIDRMFWIWQKRHGETDKLTILDGYAGTSSSDSQGPTPGVAPGTNLDMTSPLAPFKKDDGTVYVASDVVNIETQLGYTYGVGSFDGAPTPPRPDTPEIAATKGFSGRKLTVRRVDRALFQGSFVIRAFATVPGVDGAKDKEYYLGHYSVLSRHNVIRCRNCLTHLEVVAHFPLDDIPSDEADRATYRVAFQHRGALVDLATAETATRTAELPEGLNPRLYVAD